MRKKIASVLLTILFFGAMVILSFSARVIHNRMIPNVTTFRLPYVKFEIPHYMQNGQLSFIEESYLPAIPKSLYEQGEVYYIDYQIINGEERTVARAATLIIGIENDEYYEVTDIGIQRVLFIKTSDKPLHDGIEVHIVD